MHVVRTKAGVKFDRILPAGFRILGAIDYITLQREIDLEISCGTEGHALTDPHTLGEAYDLSVVGLSTDDILAVVEALRQTLGALFTVLFEGPVLPHEPELVAIAYVNPDATGWHLHVQRKKGTTYPPPPASDGSARA